MRKTRLLILTLFYGALLLCCPGTALAQASCDGAPGADRAYCPWPGVQVWSVAMDDGTLLYLLCAEAERYDRPLEVRAVWREDARIVHAVFSTFLWEPTAAEPCHTYRTYWDRAAPGESWAPDLMVAGPHRGWLPLVMIR